MKPEELEAIDPETIIRVSELKGPIYGKIEMEPWDILEITKELYNQLNEETK